MRPLVALLGTALVLALTPTVRGEAASESPAPAAADPAAAAPAAAAPAAPAPAAPAKPAPADGKLSAVVKSVEGTVESREAVGRPWTAVQVGQTLAEGTDLRTGFRARCVLDLAESLVQVDPLTVVRIGELRRDGEKVRTRIYMKQGNTQALVEKGGVKNDFAIVTPSATLSVRGTRGIQCGFFPVFGGEYRLTGEGLMEIISALLGRSIEVPPGGWTNDNAIPVIQSLAGDYLPFIFDLFGGIEPAEFWASLRWGTSTPLPAGLAGQAAALIKGLQQAQEKSSSGSTSGSGDSNGNGSGDGYNPG
jgi:hypothetical protein